MLSINTNLSSLITQRSLKQSTNKLNQAIERMTTGAKINHAKDNAANYSICTNLDTKIGAYQVAEDNCAMGLDMLATANGTLDQIYDKLQRLRDLAVQASNGTYGDQSKQVINSEANALVDEINRLYSIAEYNGIRLFGSEEAATAVATYSLAPTVTVDESKRVSNVTSLTSGETYYICDSADLVALQDLVNAGNSGAGVTFELTEDIDMQGVSFRGIGIFRGTGMGSSYSFKGIFNGNGHVVKNLTINTTDLYVGLFGYVNGAIIDSVGVENCNIKGGTSVGGLVGIAYDSIITNCYSAGSVEGARAVGGLVGDACGSTITNCYSTSTVVASSAQIGGLVGCAGDGSTITNSYSTGSVEGDSLVGGLVGYACYSARIINSYSTGSVGGADNFIGGLVGVASTSASITNSYSIGSVVGVSYVGGFLGQNYDNTVTGSGNYYNQDAFAQAVGYGSFSGVEAKSVVEINTICTPETMGFTEANGWIILNGEPRLAWEFATQGGSGGTSGGTTGGTSPTYAPDTIILQLGISANLASQVGIQTKFSLDGIDDLRMIGLDLTTDYLFQIDEFLKEVNEKQTHFGASSNRLESVLEEIIISRDNLVSSRSTLRDADIAEVSSEYIRQQILQQASATLMSTANQSASIALSLI